MALGSDVPFATFGGTALGRGRGERLTRLRLATPFRAIVVAPNWRVSTAEAFRSIDRHKYGLTAWHAESRFAAALGRERVTTILAVGSGNTFERVLGRHSERFEVLREKMRAAGIAEPHLTGSGSGIFGIVPQGVPVSRVVRRFPGREPLFAVRSVGRGVRLVASA